MAIDRTERKLAREALHHAGISTFHSVHELHRVFKAPTHKGGLTPNELAYVKKLHDQQRDLADKISALGRRLQASS